MTPASTAVADTRADSVASMPRARPARRSIRAVPARPRGRRRGRGTITFFMLLAIVNVAGLPYYLAPPAIRVRSPLHRLFKPNGYIGHTAGLLALAAFLFLWLYPLRKRIPWLRNAGSMRTWMQLHIVAGISMPILAATHAAWRFTGLIGLGFWASLIVAASGMIGRYLYVRVPRTQRGVAMTLEQIERRSQQLVNRVAAASGLPVERVEALLEPRLGTERNLSPPRAVLRLVSADLTRRRMIRRLIREMRRTRNRRRLDRENLRLIRRLARRRVALEQQLRLLAATQRLFRYWHTAHMPVAITALITVLVHVVVVVALGTTWFW